MNIGDRVICDETGVMGQIIKLYTPTASERQIMVQTGDGRQYHAPYRMWRKFTNKKCEYGVNRNEVNDKCDECKHFKYIALSDDGK